MAQMRLAVAAVGLLFLFKNINIEAVKENTEHNKKTLAEYCMEHYANEAVDKIANVAIGSGKQCTNRLEKLSARLLYSKEWRHALYNDRYANKEAFKRLQRTLADRSTAEYATDVTLAEILSTTTEMARAALARLPRLRLPLIVLPIMLIGSALNVSIYMLLWGGIDMRWERLHICSIPYRTSSTFLSSSELGGKMHGFWAQWLRERYIVLDTSPQPSLLRNDLRPYLLKVYAQISQGLLQGLGITVLHLTAYGVTYHVWAETFDHWKVPTIIMCVLLIISVVSGAIFGTVFVETLEELCAIVFYNKLPESLPVDLRAIYNELGPASQEVFLRELEVSVDKVNSAVAYVGTVMFSGVGTVLGCLLVASPFATSGVIDSTMTLLYGFTLATVASGTYVCVIYASVVSSLIAPGSYTGQRAHVIVELQAIDGFQSFGIFVLKSLILLNRLHFVLPSIVFDFLLRRLRFSGRSEGVYFTTEKFGPSRPTDSRGRHMRDMKTYKWIQKETSKKEIIPTQVPVPRDPTGPLQVQASIAFIPPTALAPDL